MVLSGKVIPEWELWACAAHMVREHGLDAATHAAMRADDLLARGDPDGVTTWILIMHRIEQLLGEGSSSLQ